MSIKVDGLDKVLKSFGEYEKDARKEIQKVTKLTADEIELTAKSLAPVDDGTLRQNIRSEKQSEPFTFRITSYMPYSAYQEFGTGGKVKIPSEWAEMASRFRGKGLKTININPQPFMYPAYLRGKKIFKNDLAETLIYLNKKFNNG